MRRYARIRIIFIKQSRVALADSDPQTRVDLLIRTWIRSKYITYALWHDAWPKSLVPIPSSVCVCVYDTPFRSVVSRKTKQKKINERIKTGLLKKKLQHSRNDRACPQTRRCTRGNLVLRSPQSELSIMCTIVYKTTTFDALNERSEQSEKKLENNRSRD